MALFGALFTTAVCWGLGRLLFSALKIDLPRFEHEVLGAFCGASLLSLGVFLLCSVRLAYPSVFLVAGTASIAAGLHRSAAPRPARALYPTWFWWLAGAAFVFYAVIYLSNSLAPELSPDGAAYHLGLVARYFRQHGFERLTTNMYASLSQGMEMLFLFAFSFGKHSAASTLHCLFLLFVPLLIASWGERIGHPGAALCAGILVYLSPVAAIDGVSAYNDTALAAVAFAMFYLLEIRRESNDDRLLVPIGLLAGFCFAIKYTGGVAVLYAAFVAGRRAPKVILSAAGVAAPWLVKNWLWVGNPVSPFFNRVFRSPYVHIQFEDFYRNYLRTYGLTSLKPLFWIVTTTGQLGGQIGPVFLLTPLAVLSLRSAVGRRCLMAAFFFLLPYPTNIGARFLIPALPFVAIALCLAVEFWPPAMPALLATAVVLAWPRVIDLYRAPAGGWQIVTVPWQAALGLVSEDEWLRRRYPEYRIAQTLNAVIPPGRKLWSTRPLAESYLERDVLVAYYSAEGEQIHDLLHIPLERELQPLWKLRFTFPTRSVTRLRILQDAVSANDSWSIGEARFFSGAKEVYAVHADAPALSLGHRICDRSQPGHPVAFLGAASPRHAR